MQEARPVDVNKYKRRRHQKKIWRNIVRIMACIVVFCTTYALILPAITMEKDAFCGIEAHVHEAQCYADAAEVLLCDPTGGTQTPVLHSHDELCYEGETLLCQLPELTGHVHTDTCYQQVTTEAHLHDESCSGLVRGTLVCEVAEEAGHAHGDACYAPGDELLCQEPVWEGHTHADACYATQNRLTCTTNEGEGHAHGDTCYISAAQLACQIAEGEDHAHTDACYVQSQSLNCQIPEAPAHTHGEGCYTEIKTLTCAEAEDIGHAHTNACYEQVLTCRSAESEGHAHADACYEMVSGIVCGKKELPAAVTETVLSCELSQIAPHVHHESCSDANGSLICTIQNAVVHQHTEECLQISQSEENLTCQLEVHEHTLPCFSDPTADVETSADWEKSISRLELTGNWREDVLAIAKSQLGYNESTKNYIVEEDGETIKGYTRYGAWYGVPYGDWCAMYVSFALHYAGVEGMPLHCNCPAWINELTKLGLYHSEAEYAPQSGDVIFFDWNADASSDHVGIVVETDGDTVKTIEGNSGNTVGYHTYRLTDSRIMGYSELPAQDAQEKVHYLCGCEEHTHDENCYDAEGNLTCEIEEHTHTEECMGRKLFYTDADIRAFVTIQGVAELPADLSVEVWQITAEENPAAYESMQTALIDKMADETQFVSEANYYGMQLLSEGVVYELPENAQVSVDVEFIQPVFNSESVENSTDMKTYILTPEADNTVAVTDENGLTVETMSVSEEATFGTALLSLLSGEEPEETVVYQADAVDGENYETTDEGLTAVSFETRSIATFAVALATETQEGTFWTRVYSTSDITSGGTYMIVSAEGSYALVGNTNTNSNYQAVVYQAVKGNTQYYTITDTSGNAISSTNMYWTITRSGSGYTIRNQGTNNYVSLSAKNQIIHGDSATLSIAAVTSEKLMRIANGNYYLRNTGGGAFGRSNENDGSYSRDEVGYTVTTALNNTKDMVIFKLSGTTELTIPADVTAGTTGGTSGSTAPTKPNYGSFITPSNKKTGDTAVTDASDTTTMVSGKYYSDPATSQLEANFRKSTYAASKTIDGRVMTDKSVIYGADDYGAFSSYAANTFSVTLSALGQEYEIPYQYMVKTPVDVVYVLDVSGSMTTNTDGGDISRAEALVEAVNSSMKQILDEHPENRVGMVLYSTGAWEMLPLDRYTATDNEYLVNVDKNVSTSNGYKVAVKMVQGSASLKSESGTSYANAGSTATQGIGTHTQAGIALGQKVFKDIGTDTTYTTTVGEGEQARTYTVKRQPVFILLSDGEPTHSTNNYADALSGPHYGNGTSDGSANAKGIHGYNTILSANYYKRMVSIQYQKPTLFYTIGMGISTTGDSTNSGTSDYYKRAVLNPGSATIGENANVPGNALNKSTTIDYLEDMLNNTFTNQSVSSSNQWPDSWYGVPHTNVPVVRANPYTNNYSYADSAYFGRLSSDDLKKIFTTILQSSTQETPYGFILFKNTSVDITDVIGEGMQIKGTPVLRYNGTNYTNPTVTENGNVTTYSYTGTYEDPYIPDREINLSEIGITVTTLADGRQQVDMVVPDSALPTYTPELVGQQFYYESLPVRLIYQVGLTEESEQAVLDLKKTGGELTFYTNDFNEDTLESAAVSTLHPSLVNPFYHDQYDEDGNLKSTTQYQEHHDPKTDNTTQTAANHVDCTMRYYTVTEDGVEEEAIDVLHKLGNNGKLVFTAEPPTLEIPVQKQWVNVVDTSELSVDITLYTVKATTAEGGAVTKEILNSQIVTLNSENSFAHTFASLPKLDGDSYYAVAESVPSGFVPSYTGGSLVDLPGENGATFQAVKVEFAEDSTTATQIVITNAPLIELPETGGTGTILYTTGGLLLMTAATLLLLHKKSNKRRKEERPSF